MSWASLLVPLERTALKSGFNIYLNSVSTISIWLSGTQNNLFSLCVNFYNTKKIKVHKNAITSHRAAYF